MQMAFPLHAARLAFLVASSFFWKPSGSYLTVTPWNAVSYCVADADGDGTDELVLIAAGRDKADYPPGGRCGSTLVILDYGGFVYGPHKILNSFDMDRLMPSKAVAGDINGDGIVEIGVCVYKTAVFHQAYAKRPFFYALNEGRLVPVWLGSRLSRPFKDYILTDLTGDGISNIAAIEYTGAGGCAVRAYAWAGFGFEAFAEGPEYADIEAIREGHDNTLVITVVEDGRKYETVLEYNGNDKLTQPGEE